MGKQRPPSGLHGLGIVTILLGLMFSGVLGHVPFLGRTLRLRYQPQLGVPFLLAAVGVQRAFKVFAFARRHARAVMRVAGLLLVAVGLLQLSGLWTAMIRSLQGVIAGWQPPL